MELNIDDFSWKNVGAGIFYLNKNGEYYNVGYQTEHETYEWNDVLSVAACGKELERVYNLLDLTDADARWYFDGESIYVRLPASKHPHCNPVSIEIT